MTENEYKNNTKTTAGSAVPNGSKYSEHDLDRYRRTSLIKLFAMGAALILLIVVGTISWFTMNREVENTGLQMTAEGAPFTIYTRSGSGTYNDVYESLETGGMEWQISSDYNFDNHENAKKEGETEPGIEPGDHGILEFRVSPNNDASITVDCVFDMKAYTETITLGANNTPVYTVTEMSDSSLVGYVKAHLMLFTGVDPNTGKYTGLIGNDETLRRVLEDQTYTRNNTAYTKIYWVWPEHLSDLTSNNDSAIIYAPSERSAVISYIANNKDGFFKDCNDSISKVSTDLTTLASSYNSTIYNHYNMKYDNADLDIGNNVSYVLLSMKVE